MAETDSDGESAGSLGDWQRRSDALESGQPALASVPIPGLLRRARRLADVSQRQLARMAGVAPSTVAKVESGAMVPSLNLFQRLVAATGLHLVVVDGRGRVVQPMRESDETRGGGDRRYPSHLDTILDPRSGEWWADLYGLARPPETFKRDRRRRDEMRARSQWEVRVKLYRNVPEPPIPGVAEARAAKLRAWQERVLDGTLQPRDIDYRELDWDE